METGPRAGVGTWSGSTARIDRGPADMIHTDGLVRYYGELAGKLARRQQAMAIVTSVLAMVSLVVSLLGVETGWTSLSIGLAVTASFFRAGPMATA